MLDPNSAPNKRRCNSRSLSPCVKIAVTCGSQAGPRKANGATSAPALTPVTTEKSERGSLWLRPTIAPAPKAPPRESVPIQPIQKQRPVILEEEFAPSLDDLVGPTREQLVGLHSGEYEAMDAARGPAESRALLAPVDEAANESAILKPLNWMSDPIAHMSARARVAVSMLAVMSFLGACAALGYVLMLRHGS